MEAPTVPTMPAARSQTAGLRRHDSAFLRVSAPPWWVFLSPEVSLCLEQFSVEQGSAGRAANGVVRQHRELPIQHVALAQAADRRRHARSKVNVKARLRTVRCSHVHDRLVGCAWQAQLLRLGAKIVPGGDDLL